ncbi:uncharacterized protein LOC125370861 [Ricinus communis]|uniref:Uncharacterized protein n=1 Tax=Ricinus communis TaxID=3988 RepID=B9RHD5_RICCO|nr:uncharacterized protein LOC125370861 [Ricinus communis]EEF49497.1 conserved hypothetical protein [Ricinus communis]
MSFKKDNRENRKHEDSYLLKFLSSWHSSVSSSVFMAAVREADSDTHSQVWHRSVSFFIAVRSRKCNAVAHGLAKVALHADGVQVWIEDDGPSWLHYLIFAELALIARFVRCLATL